MGSAPTIDDVLRLAAGLSAIDKLRVIERLAPQVESALGDELESNAAAIGKLDEKYQRGYEQTPEDITDLEALLPHLPAEQWK